MPPTPASDDLKRCTKCGEEKPREEFAKDRSRKLGRKSVCKSCDRERPRQHRPKGRGSTRAWRKRRELVFGGPGRDRVNSRDSHRDRVRCGAGRDRVKADRRDRLRGCEVVRRRPMEDAGIPGRG